MNERIRRLREQSLKSAPEISPERALLLTEFYRDVLRDGVATPVARALAFQYILAKKKICINDGELIVGERGPGPGKTPTYPEICTHSPGDFAMLSGREKIRFAVSDETLKAQEERIIPFWKGRSIRERIFEEADEKWKAAYEAGMFTEFQEQRAPGHTVLGGRIYRMGFEDFKKEIEESLNGHGPVSGQAGDAARSELEAMRIAADALVMYAERHAAELEGMAGAEGDPARKAELLEMARICRKVPRKAPGTFHEALQYYWFVHLGVITELNTWDSFNPGRLDQHLLPFYTKGISGGTLTRESARELLQAFWIKFNNQPAPPKVGVTAQESSTYTDFCLINLGGVTGEGKDAVNEVTWLILDVIEEMRLLQPSSMIQVSVHNPDEYVHRALRIIRTGYGQPSVFNTEAIIGEMLRQGKTLEDARNGGASGCVETGAFGREAYILTGYFNLPKVLEITLNDGVDPRSGRMVGTGTGAAASFGTFDEFYSAFRRQLRYFIDVKIEGNLRIERLWAESLPAPFMSILIDDCISNAIDYNAGGARYNTSYIQGVGLGSVSDSMTSIKLNVFERKIAGLDELAAALKADFKGYEELRRIMLDETPKYGNDDDYADDIMRMIFDDYFAAVDGRPNYKGGAFRINMLPTTCHVYFGRMTGALPDGRRAGTPLSEGISPVQGADREGPTAVLKSAAKFDHLKTGGTLLNQKFTPALLGDEEGIAAVGGLIRAYFGMMGHHIQFNVVSADTLRKAQREPDRHRDLIVRVAGYSDYFVDLGRDLQDEIIARTEHGTAL